MKHFLFGSSLAKRHHKLFVRSGQSIDLWGYSSSLLVSYWPQKLLKVKPKDILFLFSMTSYRKVTSSGRFTMPLMPFSKRLFASHENYFYERQNLSPFFFQVSEKNRVIKCPFLSLKKECSVYFQRYLIIQQMRQNYVKSTLLKLAKNGVLN